MTITVRPAVITDALALSRIGAATFRETFENENTPEDMTRYLADSFSPEHQAAEIADPASTVLLAEHHGANTDWLLVRSIAPTGPSRE